MRSPAVPRAPEVVKEREEEREGIQPRCQTVDIYVRVFFFRSGKRKTRRGREGDFGPLREEFVDNLDEVLHGLCKEKRQEDGQPSDSAGKGERGVCGANLSHRALLESGEGQPVPLTNVPKLVSLLPSTSTARETHLK